MKIYILNNVVVVNEKSRPQSVGCSDNYDSIESFLKAQRDVREWEDSSKEVSNWYYGTEDYKGYHTVGIGLNYIRFSEGEEVEVEDNEVTAFCGAAK